MMQAHPSDQKPKPGLFSTLDLGSTFSIFLTFHFLLTMFGPANWVAVLVAISRPYIAASLGLLGLFMVWLLRKKWAGGLLLDLPSAFFSSWDGLLGGLLMVLLTIILLAVVIPNGTNGSVTYGLMVFITMGIIVVLGALAGDWLASYYKRRHGVKDFSTIIPGHGGFLDRFDSWLVAGALIGWVSMF